jgi:hypothetical protein
LCHWSDCVYFSCGGVFFSHYFPVSSQAFLAAVAEVLVFWVITTCVIVYVFRLSEEHRTNIFRVIEFGLDRCWSDWQFPVIRYNIYPYSLSIALISHNAFYLPVLWQISSS